MEAPALSLARLGRTKVRHRCSFRSAVASRKQRDLRGQDAPVQLDMYLTAVHEAGHAVICYAVGLGCGEIALTAHILSKGAYGGTDGESGSGMKAGNRTGDAFHRGEFNQLLLGNAVLAMAGMAAERKAMIGLGVPPHVAAGASGDRALWNDVAKIYVRQDRRRTKFAFAARVWRIVQDAVDDPRIWQAVLHIARRLFEGLSATTFRKRKAKIRHALPGRAAVATMLRHGVRAGMLQPDLTG